VIERAQVMKLRKTTNRAYTRGDRRRDDRL